MRRTIFTFCFFAFSICAWGQERDPSLPALTLEEAVRLAQAGNRDVRIAQLDLNKAESQLAATRTKRLPSTSLYLFGSQLLTQPKFRFPAGAFGDFPATGPIPADDSDVVVPRTFSLNAMARLDQPLTQLYKINLGVKLKSFEREVREQKLRAEQQRVRNEVRKLYYAALESESSLTASEEALKLYRELDRMVAEYVVQQVALKSDSLDVKSRLAKEEYDVLTTRHELALRKEQLNLLLGRDVRAEFRLVLPEESPYEADLASAQSRALAQRPEVRQARLQVEQAEADRRLKRADYIPDVSLSFQYLTFFNSSILPRNFASAGILLQWEPFDWGRRKHEIAEKSQQLEQAQAALREAEQRVFVDVNDRFRKLSEARALIRVTAAVQDSAREKLRVTRNRFGEKATLLKDVLQSQSDLAEANHSSRQALLSFFAAQADFERAIGDDR